MKSKQQTSDEDRKTDSANRIAKGHVLTTTDDANPEGVTASHVIVAQQRGSHRCYRVIIDLLDDIAILKTRDLRRTLQLANLNPDLVPLLVLLPTPIALLLRPTLLCAIRAPTRL